MSQKSIKKPKKIKPLKKPTEPEVFRREHIQPKTEGQRELIYTLAANKVTVAIGPAGTGKTAISIGYAIDLFLGQQVDKIILTRPALAGGNEDLGALPGTSDEKLFPYLIPMLEELKKYGSHSQISEWRNSKAIEIVPLSFIRGRTFNNAVIVVDEASNCTFEQLKMIVTRLGQNSKMIISGDPDQSDLPPKARGALQKFYDKLEGEPDIGTIKLGNIDIVRNELIARILQRLDS